MRRMIIFASLLLLVGGCDTEQEARDTLLKRHSVEFETATVSVLSPGPLKKRPYTLSPEEKFFTLNSEYFTTELPDLEVAVSWVRQREGPLNLLGGIEGIMSSLEQQGVFGLEYQTHDATVSGLSALRASATYKTPENRAQESVVITRHNEAWQVTVFASLRDKETAQRIIESVEVRAQKVEQTKIKITLEGQIYLNGTEASFEKVKQELQRLSEANGIVLYYREGGNTPPPAAESVSVAIMNEIRNVGLPNPVWSEEANK